MKAIHEFLSYLAGANRQTNSRENSISTESGGGNKAMCFISLAKNYYIFSHNIVAECN